MPERPVVRIGVFFTPHRDTTDMREVLEAWRPVVDEEIARLLPRVVDDAYLAAAFGAPTHEYDAGALQHALADPIWALLDRGGKRWRAVVCLQLVEGFGEDPEAYLPYAVIPEILHNGTIIVDDVEDDATKRRGGPALHLEHGTDIALNAGNAMYFLPLKVITRNPADLDAETRLRAWEMLMDELNRTHLGQGMDICWHNQKRIDVSEAEYFEMGACKTGCLGRIVARLAAIVTGQPPEVEREIARYAERMSIAFQIGDDILDVEHTLDQAGEFGKEFGNDVREGKKTLMVIHAAAHADPADVARLEEILWAEDSTDEEILEAIEIMQDAGAVEYARERALELSEQARNHLDGLDLEPTAERHLREFTRFVIEREA
jgi:geranylgeranyl diphosphate synthase type I